MAGSDKTENFIDNDDVDFFVDYSSAMKGNAKNEKDSKW